jgi:hypothetical protein
MRSTVPAVAALSLLALLAAACGTGAGGSSVGGQSPAAASTHPAAASTQSPGANQASSDNAAAAGMTPGTPNNGKLPYVDGNPGCVLTPDEMGAILNVSVGQVHDNYGPQQQYPDDHSCGFGAVPVPGTKKYLYFADVEVRCGQDGLEQFQGVAGQYGTRAQGTVHNVRIMVKDPAHPQAARITYVRVGGCTVSALPAFNAKTGDFARDQDSELIPVARALDAAAGRAA